MKKIIFSNDIDIFVPDSLKMMTTYILIEQLDWFEDEIKFLNKFIYKDNNVIDIGANYGVYTLTLAKLIGDKGHVFSFEPCSETRKFLKKSIDANNYKNVTVNKHGLSNKKQVANLSINKDSEINTVTKETSLKGNYEKISLSNLDSFIESYGWKDIDFIKIDAEGQESNIIAGGKEFFKINSPLVQYEVKDKESFNFSLIKEFESIGYYTYRLVPGLEILVPWDDIQFDDYILNLFCCKEDKANKLSAKSLLINKSSLGQDNSNKFNQIFKELISKKTFYDNINISIPYINFLMPYWKNSKEFHNINNEKAIFLYFISQNNEYSIEEKYSAIKFSFLALSEECKINSGNARLCSLARISGDLGLRSTQVAALIQLRDNIYKDKNFELGEIFLLPQKNQENDSLKNWGSEISNWMLSNILTTIEKKEEYSSYYSQNRNLDQLRQIKALGYDDEEINRRINLIETKFKN